MALFRSLKIVHTADFHLGNRFVGLEGNKVEEIRREDMYRNLDIIANYCIRNHIDLVLISGDIFHRSNPNPRDFVRFSSFIGKLTGNGTYVVIIAGNHDKPKISGAKNPLEGLVEAGVPRLYYFQQVPNEPLILRIKDKFIGIAPIPYIDPTVLKAYDIQMSYEKYMEKWITYFRDKMSELNLDFRILMAHVMLREADLTKIPSLYAEEPKIGYGSLHEDSFDYVALGHVHKPQQIGRRTYYCGSIERMAFDEENEKKGFYYLELTGDGVHSELVELPCRPMVTRKLKIESMSRDEIINTFRRMQDIPKNCILRLIIEADREMWSLIDELRVRIRDILLTGLGVLGYSLRRSIIDIHTPINIELDTEFSIRKRVLEYIESFKVDPELKIRAKELAISIMDEVMLR